MGTNQNCKQFYLYMNNWDKGVGLAMCPSKSGSTILGEINMQWNIAGATPTSSRSYTMCSTRLYTYTQTDKHTNRQTDTSIP